MKSFVDKLLVCLTIVVMIIGVLTCGYVYGKIKEQKEPEVKQQQEDTGYYQMDTHGVYVHDSKVYLDKTFSKSIGKIYRDENNKPYIQLYKKVVELQESDLDVVPVQKETQTPDELQKSESDKNE